MKRDEYGRRLFKSEARALEAQAMQARYQGIFTGIVRSSPGRYHLIVDSTASLYQENDSD